MTRSDLEARVAERTPAAAHGRTHLFLHLYWQIADAWDAKLKAERAVDFEDMLVAAAEHLEAGRVQTPWTLVLVDELQDASRARPRLTRALVAAPGRHLLAVGDDWQSINRFAGADIAVMTGFNQWFGAGPELKLQTTFRCPQALCDTASEFVSKNPRQLSKQVQSAHADAGPIVRLIIASAADRLSAELRAELQYLAQEAAPRPTSVDVLGRYNFDRKLMPQEAFAGLTVTFRTAHSSKGLEADYVIVPNLTSGTYGFPSTIQDDPVLSLAMADPDEYPHAEERRLFYVALTRARRQVTLLTVQGRESPFIAELLRDQRVHVVRSPGPPPQPCPTCGEGVLVQRKGPYGAFLGCSTFPRCRHTTKISQKVDVASTRASAHATAMAAIRSGWSDEPPFWPAVPAPRGAATRSCARDPGCDGTSGQNRHSHCSKTWNPKRPQVPAFGLIVTAPAWHGRCAEGTAAGGCAASPTRRGRSGRC